MVRRGRKEGSPAVQNPSCTPSRATRRASNLPRVSGETTPATGKGSATVTPLASQASPSVSPPDGGHVNGNGPAPGHALLPPSTTRHEHARAMETVAASMGAQTPRDRKLLAGAIVQGRLNDEDCRALGQVAAEQPDCLAERIAAHPRLDPQSVTEINCFANGLPWAALSDQQIDRQAAEILPAETAELFTAVPMAHGIDNRGSWVHVAVADPWAKTDIAQLRANLQERFERVEVFGADAERVRRAIAARYVRGSDEAEAPPTLQSGVWQRFGTASDASEMLTEIVADAIRREASDIDIRPAPDAVGTQCRLRIDARWVIAKTIAGGDIHRRMVNAAKIQFKCKLEDNRKAQSGRSTFPLGDGREVDLRAQFMPLSNRRERVVMRIFDRGRVPLALDGVGFTPETLRRFRAGIKQPYGCILMCGPMGSGKSTTLYAALQELTDDSRNLVTIEDPVEYEMPEICQTQVDEEHGLTYVDALKATLRCQADVIMVGEIRDGETAHVAMRGAVTGSLLLATIHANAAVEAPTVLIRYGVEAPLVASALLVVVSQRLVRVLCPHCRIPHTPTTADLMKFGYDANAATRFLKHLTASDAEHFHVANPDGCGRCDFGFHGRTAIQELMVLTEEMRDLISAGGGTTDALAGGRRGLQQMAIEAGMTTLAEDGIRRAAAGETTLDEVISQVGEVVR